MPITWILEAELDPKRADDLLRLSEAMSTEVRETEPGCLLYDWFLSPDGTRCHILERYTDDRALLTHVAGVNAGHGRALFRILKPKRLMVYGNPGPEAREAIAALRPEYMPSL